MTIWTPSWSMVTSSGRRMSSKAIPYCMPEQPPPLTKMRSASWGFPSLARSSLRRTWASGVSETAACSITFWMLPRSQFTSPPCGEVGAQRRAGRSGRSAPAYLEPLLGLFLPLGAGRACDQLSQLLGAAGDRALRIGEDQDLASHGGLVGLGAVEIDLDRELLLERADHVLPAHDRLRHLVVEGEDDAAGDDVEHVGEDVQQLANVLE